MEESPGNVGVEESGQLDDVEAFRKSMEEIEKRFIEAERTKEIDGDDQKAEANAWLARTGWAQHLEGLKRCELLDLMAPVHEEDEEELKELCESMGRVMDAAQGVCRRNTVGLAALFEINRRDNDKKAGKPFEARMESDSWVRYKEVMMTIVRVLFRVDVMDDDKRPPFQFTEEQDKLWGDWTESAERRVKARVRQKKEQERERWKREYAILGSSDDDSSNEEEVERVKTVQADEIDRQGLEFMMQMLDHNIVDNEYENGIISAMAVMGVEGSGGWCSPMNYTPKMSAFVKVMRMLAVYSAYRARDRELKAAIKEEQYLAWRSQGIGEERRARTQKEIAAKMTGIFPRVRKMVRSFMTRIGGEADQHPVPMDWILETRTYGMYIRFNTTAAASIDWSNDGSEVVFHRQKVRMAELTAMFYGMVDDAREMMEELTMLGDGEIEKLPSIPWGSIEDDNSEQRDGYSFLADSRNSWTQKGDSFVFNHIIEKTGLRRKWISTKAGLRHPIREEAVQAYHKKIEKFREVLWCMMHMISGQPARATEILGIRYKNTANGGARNIFINHGQVSWVTAYHKNFRQTNEAKIIHRFLPREVGELLVWYLWLVLPFWQKMQGIIKGASGVSAAVWGLEMVERRKADTDEGYGSGDDGDGDRDDGGGGGFIEDGTITSGDELPRSWNDWIRERRWTTDRVRRVMGVYSEKYMGHRLSIASWRHIAIAITRYHLGAKSNAAFGEMEEEDEDEIDDQAADLQAGHGTHVAGLVYARAMFENTNGTALMRERFREASMGWHRFFMFTGGHTV